MITAVTSWSTTTRMTGRGAWSRGYTFALSRIMLKCHFGLSDEDRQRIADWRENHWKDTE